MSGQWAFGRFVPEEQIPPDPQHVTDQVVQRFEHVFEVDPERMGIHFKQQRMLAWDTKRIVAARWDHLDSIHSEFADEVLLAGEGPETEPPSTHNHS